ncbi:hypothetical protein OROMI_022977 [Orobanche minor]
MLVQEKKTTAEILRKKNWWYGADCGGGGELLAATGGARPRWLRGSSDSIAKRARVRGSILGRVMSQTTSSGKGSYEVELMIWAQIWGWCRVKPRGLCREFLDSGSVQILD